jgi:hypothetical protein
VALAIFTFVVFRCFIFFWVHVLVIMFFVDYVVLYYVQIH